MTMLSAQRWLNSLLGSEMYQKWPYKQLWYMWRNCNIFICL